MNNQTVQPQQYDSVSVWKAPGIILKILIDIIRGIETFTPAIRNVGHALDESTSAMTKHCTVLNKEAELDVLDAELLLIPRRAAIQEQMDAIKQKHNLPTSEPIEVNPQS